MANPFSNTKLATSKSDFLDVVNVLPERYRELVKQGAVRLVDRSFYSVKALENSTTKELMAASDTQKVGITNVNNRKMEASQYFLLKGIRIQTANIAGADEITDAKLAAADFTGALNTDVGADNGIGAAALFVQRAVNELSAALHGNRNAAGVLRFHRFVFVIVAGVVAAPL